MIAHAISVSIASIERILKHRLNLNQRWIHYDGCQSCCGKINWRYALSISFKQIRPRFQIFFITRFVIDNEIWIYLSIFVINNNINNGYLIYKIFYNVQMLPQMSNQHTSISEYFDRRTIPAKHYKACNDVLHKYRWKILPHPSCSDRIHQIFKSYNLKKN